MFVAAGGPIRTSPTGDCPMAERITRQLIAEKAIVCETPVLRNVAVDRSFELPTGLYVSMAALFFAAAGVLALGFAAPLMVVPTSIIAVLIAMFFAVPAMWVRMKPDHKGHTGSWNRFRLNGVMTPYGRSTANAATVQMLILPALILFWAVAVVTIAAVVR